MAAAAISADPVRAPAERHPERVLVILIPLGFVAAASLFAAGPEFAAFLREGHTGVFVTLLAATVAARAVSVELIGIPGKMSFEFVVVLSAAILYGAAVAVIIAAAAELLVQFVYRPSVIARAWNGVSVILQAGAAGVVATVVGGSGRPSDVIVATAAASVTWIAVGTGLCCTALARAMFLPTLGVLKQAVHELAVPHLFMTSLVALIVVAWRESPLLALAAIGPIAAIVLLESRRIQVATANLIALTDPLTAIGNRRHFDERLASELERAERLKIPFSLCLIDIDDFKTINDSYGHAAGDGVLSAIASCLRGGGEAFRCGGDEFALLLPGYSEIAAAEAATAICARIGELTDPGGRPLVISAGTATASPVSSDPADLLRAADDALYAQKRERSIEIPA